MNISAVLDFTFGTLEFFLQISEQKEEFKKRRKTPSCFVYGKEYGISIQHQYIHSNKRKQQTLRNNVFITVLYPAPCIGFRGVKINLNCELKDKAIKLNLVKKSGIQFKLLLSLFGPTIRLNQQRNNTNI